MCNITEGNVGNGVEFGSEMLCPSYMCRRRGFDVFINSQTASNIQLFPLKMSRKPRGRVGGERGRGEGGMHQIVVWDAQFAVVRHHSDKFDLWAGRFRNL